MIAGSVALAASGGSVAGRGGGTGAGTGTGDDDTGRDDTGRGPGTGAGTGTGDDDTGRADTGRGPGTGTVAGVGTVAITTFSVTGVINSLCRFRANALALFAAFFLEAQG